MPGRLYLSPILHRIGNPPKGVECWGVMDSREPPLANIPHSNINGLIVQMNKHAQKGWVGGPVSHRHQVAELGCALRILRAQTLSS